jgi:predicted NBD/HSP70 family sugar kinase/biotin operon repressor
MDRPAKATMRETREHNERLVLATTYDAGPISRAEVARLTGLTRTTVSDVMDGLLEAGLCREVGRGPSTGGKAPILVEVPDAARLLVGVDLGDRVFTAATVNLRGEIIHRVDVPSEDTDGDVALGLALDLIGQVIDAAEGPILGIGIGAPGLVDTSTGTVIQAVKRDWRQLPLGAIVAERFGLPVHVANDSQAAGLAEHVFGAVRAQNLITVKVGQGIGAGLVLNGELFEGDGYGAGEIGHWVVDPAGELCRCGRRGCLETVASTRAVLNRLVELCGHSVSLEQAVTEFQAGDAQTREVVLEAGHRLGAALAALIGALHVRRIVLAGTMTAFGDRWLEAVSAAAADRALAALAEGTTFEIGRMDDIVVLGASALLMTRELGMSLRPLHSTRRLRLPDAPVDDATVHSSAIAVRVLAGAAAEKGGVPG